MVVTEVWLEVKNGRTVVLDAETARKQQKRWHKKRKANATTNRPPGAKKRKQNHGDDEDARSVPTVQLEEEGEPHENLQLFADAQARLQQEMEAAGFGENALPLSFGSSHATSAVSTFSKRRKRQRHDQTDGSHAHDSMTLEHAVVVARPVAMEKVHVTFDSDGEITDRVVEAVVIPQAETTNDEALNEAANGAMREDAVTEPVDAPDAEPIDQVQETVEPQVDPTVIKFWKQRRSLFHKYDEGIQLDHESWYSVTPESIAQHIAARCACDVIVDPFSGCGGNIIQFAKTCKQVIAIEIDADKIRMAKANAAIYGVADRIEWIHGDALAVLPMLRAGVVFLSPPWGGMDYNRRRFGVADMMVGDTSGVELFEMARRVAKNVVYYLPKTTPEAELQALAPDEAVECEHIHLNGQLKVVNAYYGDLAFTGRDGEESSGDADHPASLDGQHGSVVSHEEDALASSATEDS